MTPADDILKTIRKWAKEQNDIRAVILLGSRARRGGADHLSDIDLGLFVTNPQVYFQHETWLKKFAPLWLSIAEEDNNNMTWKVIYQEGVMVEFMLYPQSALDEMQVTLPPIFEPGYKVLIDKDRLARKLPKPSGKNIAPEAPTGETFQGTIDRFWFDAYQVAKHLWRNELWRVKHYDWKLKQHLLQMMGWHAVVLRGQKDFTTYQGKHLQDWTEPETHTGLMTIFGRYYPADSWRALMETIKIFTKISGEIADALKIDDRQDLIEKFSGLIQSLQNNPDED